MALRVLSIFGTRPEAIKMAPVVRELARTPGVESRVCVTAQHRQMLDQVLELFQIVPDHDLDIMRADQDLSNLTANILLRLRGVLAGERPDVVLVQGDTTTCFVGALAAFYQGIPVAHIEAGLRTGNLAAPFPEEANRRLVSRIASYHFAPTERARQNLVTEGITDDRIWVTGNTVIDALLFACDQLERLPASTWRAALGGRVYDRLKRGFIRLVLITGHRRENFGQGFRNLCLAIKELAERHPDWAFVYPVHLNPNVRRPVFSLLHGCPNVILIEPLDYLPFVWLMSRADLILTDSGGIQEEAPALGKPVLVMREITERPEAVEAGTVRLVGTARAKIVDSIEELLLEPHTYARMARAHNPYGDGRAAKKTLSILVRRMRRARTDYEAVTEPRRAAYDGYFL